MRTLLLAALAGLALGPMSAQAQSGQITSIADSLGVPGAAWSIVRDGKVAELGATGFTDGARPVDASTSVFRVASISKVATAAVAARMAARGEVDLDADLRASIEWLGERLRHGEPLTLRQLLTHTSGLDDRLTGMLARAPDEIEDLGEHLRENLPPRTTEPGRYIRYSNYGFALAGHVLARAADLPFDELAVRELFEPLGMGRSTFIQPLPDSLRDGFARAYPCPDFLCEPRPVDYRQTPPAGALVTTAADMGRFMAAVLTDGLGAEATRILTTRSFAQHEGLPGIALALQEQGLAGRRALVHAGTSSGYRALLVLVPEIRSGFFLVASGGETEFGREALLRFEQTLAPETPDGRLAPRAATDSEIAEYEGSYLLSRAAHGTVERFPGLFAFGTVIGFDDDGYLVRREGGVRRRFGLVEPELFQSLQGPERIAFSREGTRVRAMFAADEFFGIRFPASYERLPAWEAPRAVNELLSWLIGLPVILLAIWLVFGLARLVAARAGTFRPRRKMSPGAGLAAVIVTSSMLLYGFGFLARLNRMAMDSPEELGYGLPESLAALMPLAWAFPVLAFVTLVLARRKSAFADRMLLTVTGLCTALFSALLVHFNLLPPTW